MHYFSLARRVPEISALEPKGLAWLYGLISRPGFIGMLISAELILNAAGLNFVAFNTFLAPDKSLGQTFTLFIMGLAAAEAAICLSIAVVVYRHFRSILADDLSQLKD